LGLHSLLSASVGIHVVGEAGSVAEAVALAERLDPDVVVMDVRLPDGSGVEACREIRSRRPETKVIMLTSYADDEALFTSIMAGAAGYLLKQTRGRDLIAAINTVHRGGSLLDPAVTRQVFERLRNPNPATHKDPLSELTPQEQRILSLMAEGKTNREIGKEVFLSDKTVKHYVSSILQKLQVARRSEAAAVWARSQHDNKTPD